MDMLKPPPPLNLSASNIKQAFIDWKQKFQLYFIASGAEGKLKDEQQCALLLHSVGDEGLAVYNTLENKESLKFKDILEKLEAHCSPPSNETYNRHVFFSRKQKVGETFEDFVTSLKKLSMECNFEKLKDGLVRDQIILGLLDDDLKENLLRIQDLNLEKCIHRCRAAETTKTQMDNIKNKEKLEIGKIGAENTRRMKKEDQQWENKERGRSISRQPSGTRQPSSARQPSSTRQPASRGRQPPWRNNKKACGKCGRQHQYRNCPAFNKKCIICGRYNHFAAMCLNKCDAV
ncbi:uncharacterized protein [Choristoneura fumiferana]|uniref:uncharacterized protein n=1 Tax=Choristoneura fumiferana TaxID=7141 RepID=UPI003D159DF2